MKHLTAALLLGLGLGIPTAGSAANTIDTTPFANSTAFPFGELNTPSYGQTFATPNVVDTRLDSFTFVLMNTLGVDQPFQAYVSAWSEVTSQPIGPMLFTSGPQILPASATSFTEITLATGGINLAPSVTHVAFFSTLGLEDSAEDRSTWQTIGNSTVYTPGNFVFSNQGSFLSPWDCGTPCGYEGGSDLAFRMSFSPSVAAIPEPSTYALMLAGLGLIGFVANRRRKSESPRGQQPA